MGDATPALLEVRREIAAACRRTGRDPGEVTLIGAAKTVPAARLQLFLDAGLSDLGENYVQEAVPKIDVLGRVARWHCIGALQSNKAVLAVRYFDVIHSVDRLSLAAAIQKAAGTQDKMQEVLLQVNVGDEATKAGCSLDELPHLAAACGGMGNLQVRGLMCLPPYHEDAARTRPYFRQLRAARDALLKDGVLDAAIFNHLSMGMSHDFEVAVEEGATMVRIGTRLFGARPA
ncbi:MAG TPA: YggS family pyridoxal phosphate-dependent enzyme [Abditibacteriaceae bacterium]|nr:YggS family pyridoxal phosphate-dependent enzyme [Abditibacteriaceae bacterium]